jgi:hypothetical protein
MRGYEEYVAHPLSEAVGALEGTDTGLLASAVSLAPHSAVAPSALSETTPVSGTSRLGLQQH